jgi:hypothetical protein
MSGSMDAPAGYQEPRTDKSEYSSWEFLIRSILNKAWTMTLVEVVSCTNSGGLTPEGTVSVRPLVHQRAADGTPVPHDVIPNLLYFRNRGGKNGIIMDPEAGDQGFAIFAHSDISLVKSRNAAALPGTFRRNDPADGIFMPGTRNGVPTQYIQMNSDGITLVSPTKVIVQSPEIDLTATTKVAVSAPNMDFDGNVAITGTTLTHNGVNVGSTHKHMVTSAPGITSVPE